MDLSPFNSRRSEGCVWSLPPLASKRKRFLPLAVLILVACCSSFAEASVSDAYVSEGHLLSWRRSEALNEATMSPIKAFPCRTLSIVVYVSC